MLMAVSASAALLLPSLELPRPSRTSAPVTEMAVVELAKADPELSARSGVGYESEGDVAAQWS